MQDHEEAIKQCRKAAQQGVPEVYYVLGSHCMPGESVEQSGQLVVDPLCKALSENPPSA